MERKCISEGLYTFSGARKYLNAEERLRFLTAAQEAQPEIAMLCLTLAYTGCRISEALHLTHGDIQPPGVIAIRCLKKRGRCVVREVPVPERLVRDLRRVHGLSSSSELLWPHGRTWAWRVVKDVMAVARIAHGAATPRGLRHGFGVHAVCSGVPLNLVQKWLGHADIATTAIYTNALGPEERAIAGRMWT